MEKSEQFNLLAAKLEQAKRDAIRRLDAEIFSVDAMTSRMTVPGTRELWWKHWLFWHIKSYVIVLWWALCGKDLIERPEDTDW